MNMKQIETSLQQLFNEPLRPEENRKVVFWYDYDEEFVDDFSKIKLTDV